MDCGSVTRHRLPALNAGRLPARYQQGPYLYLPGQKFNRSRSNFTNAKMHKPRKSNRLNNDRDKSCHDSVFEPDHRKTKASMIDREIFVQVVFKRDANQSRDCLQLTPQVGAVDRKPHPFDNFRFRISEH